MAVFIDRPPAAYTASSSIAEYQIRARITIPRKRMLGITRCSDAGIQLAEISPVASPPTQGYLRMHRFPRTGNGKSKMVALRIYMLEQGVCHLRKHSSCTFSKMPFYWKCCRCEISHAGEEEQCGCGHERCSHCEIMYLDYRVSEARLLDSAIWIRHAKRLTR